MTINNAAVRVNATGVDLDLTRSLELPAFLGVHIPALDETRFYDTREVTEEQLIDMLAHGMSQKLTDAAANTKGDRDKALDAVAKREKTVWALTGTRGAFLDPVTREMYDLVLDQYSNAKVPTKNWPKVRDFPKWLDSRPAEAVAALRSKAEVQLEAKKAANAEVADIGLDIG